MENLNSSSTTTIQTQNNLNIDNTAQHNEINLFNKLSEEDVGISEYINNKSKGFSCVLKHRYSDFLVNEIDVNGNVVWLKTDAKLNIENLSHGAEAQTKSLTKEDDLESIIKEHFVLNNLLSNEIDAVKFKEFVQKYFDNELNNDDRLYIDYIEDKNNRRIFHEKIREFFDFLDSETISEAHGGSSWDNSRNKNKFKNKSKEDPRGRNTKNDTDDKKVDNLPVLAPGEKKMVIFVNRNKRNFHKKRKIFPNSNKKVLHFSMMKRNIDTVQAVSYIARILHRSNKTIKFAGNKDKRGITTQRISAYSTLPEELASVTKQKFWDKRIEIDNFEFREEELRLGLLKGNQFSVVFRFLKNETEEIDWDSEISESVKSIEHNGFINYFGMQRFGVSTVPTHKVGLHILKNQWRDAVVCILSTFDIKDALRQLGIWKKINNEQDGSINYQKFASVFDSIDNISDILKIIPKFSIESNILSSMRKTGKNSFLTGFKSLNRQLQLLYPHAYQSYIWNKSVSMRIKKYGLQLLIGDIVKKKTAGDRVDLLFENVDDVQEVEEGVAAENTGLITSEIVNDNVEENNNTSDQESKEVDVDKIFE